MLKWNIQQNFQTNTINFYLNTEVNKWHQNVNVRCCKYMSLLVTSLQVYFCHMFLNRIKVKCNILAINILTWQIFEVNLRCINGSFNTKFCAAKCTTIFFIIFGETPIFFTSGSYKRSDQVTIIANEGMGVRNVYRLMKYQLAKYTKLLDDFFFRQHFFQGALI